MTDPSKKREDKPGSNKEKEVDFTQDPLKDKIGSSLKQLYDDVVNEPVPDDFMNLLAKADKKPETGKS